MKRFRAAPLALLLAALALGVTACSPKKDQAPPQPKVTAAVKGAAAPVAALPVLGVAPAWKLQDLNGAAVTSEQLKGKVGLLPGTIRMMEPGKPSDEPQTEPSGAGDTA